MSNFSACLSFPLLAYLRIKIKPTLPGNIFGHTPKMPGALSIALLLAVASLQLQSAGATPFFPEQPAALQAVTATSLIKEVEQFVKVRQYSAWTLGTGKHEYCSRVHAFISTRMGCAKYHSCWFSRPLNGIKLCWSSLLVYYRAVNLGYH